MENEFINLTNENIENEHLCCIIRQKKPHEGIEAKRKWLAARLCEGHVFRKLNVKGEVFIEYAPLESAWVPIEGDNFLYIYCLWVNGEFKGKGYGKALLEYCIADAKLQGKSGVCMLGAAKQKHWLTNQDFAKSYGFKMVDTTKSGYELLALMFDDTAPHFSRSAKKETISDERLTVYYDYQCPYILQFISAARDYCSAEGIAAEFILVDTLQKAKALPCVFNNCAVFYKGKFQTVNLPDVAYIERLVKRQDKK